jgi:hypothetical protein
MWTIDPKDLVREVCGLADSHEQTVLVYAVLIAIELVAALQS